MQINASLPVLSSAHDVGSAGLQTKVSAGAEQKTQIQEAVEPSGETGTDGGDGATLANKEGRGRLLDVKV